MKEELIVKLLKSSDRDDNLIAISFLSKLELEEMKKIMLQVAKKFDTHKSEAYLAIQKDHPDQFGISFSYIESDNWTFFIGEHQMYIMKEKTSDWPIINLNE